MTGIRGHWRSLVIVLSAFCGTNPPLFGNDLASPQPPSSVIRALEAFPMELRLEGRDDARQLLVMAALTDGQEQDLTGAVVYTVADPKVAKVTTRGRVFPLADGTSTIVADYAGRRVTIPLSVASAHAERPVNFPNQVVPVFTKLGCNSGGCHGKLSGQNGFRLSLLGFDPKLDHDTLVNEARGRRVFVPAPDQSLLLLKATGRMPHGGGRRLAEDSDDYAILRRWIAAGAPAGSADDAVVSRITIVPERRALTRRNLQQLAVFAEYSDGRREDVTRRAQYESNDDEVAVVDGEGLVRTLELGGEAAVMVRYQGQVAVFRALVPLGTKTPAFDFPERTLVDRHTQAKWRALGIAPAALCTDLEFLRRASLDITGTLPTLEQVRAFIADSSPEKRSRLVDALLESEGYAELFAHKWADILRVNRRNQQERIYGTFAFHGWIREAIASDKPYDAFVREILGALGDERQSPAAVWYKELRQPEQLVDDTSQVFLGVRMACAQCHHHPYEKWGQDDYWGLAAFFGRLRRKPVVEPGVVIQNNDSQKQAISVATTGGVINKRTGRLAVMRALDGPPLEPAPGEDPRQLLVDWMVDAKNPFFARAVANRYWAHFFGRGIVDPPDDMRLTNPPTNPALLDALADDLIAHGYSLKHLIRTICKSRTYQLSAQPNESNRADKHSYARYYPKRLSAEVLYDAIAQVTDTPATFDGLPRDSHAPRRAIMLPDESFASYFLDVFGRPQRQSACECERVGEANLAQVLHLLNSQEVQDRVARQGARAETLAKDSRPDAEKLNELFLIALGHRANPGQLEAALAHIARNAKNKKTAYENILWSLLNTKEFSFNQ